MRHSKLYLTLSITYRISIKTHAITLKEDAIKQQESMTIEGFPERNIAQSYIPKAKAYDGSIPEGEEGIEFTTDVPPDNGSRPGKPCWSGPRPGVTIEDDRAQLKIQSIRVVYFKE